MNGRPSVQPTHTLRRDQPAHTYSCSTRVTQPASQPSDVPEGWPTQIRVRPLPFLILTYQPDPPTYLPEFYGLWLSFWKWEKESWREISLQEPPSAVFLQVVVIRPSVLSSFASLYLLFLPLSPKVTKNQTPWQAHFDDERKCTDLNVVWKTGDDTAKVEHLTSMHRVQMCGCMWECVDDWVREKKAIWILMGWYLWGGFVRYVFLLVPYMSQHQYHFRIILYYSISFNTQNNL